RVASFAPDFLGLALQTIQQLSVGSRAKQRDEAAGHDGCSEMAVLHDVLPGRPPTWPDYRALGRAGGDLWLVFVCGDTAVIAARANERSAGTHTTKLRCRRQIVSFCRDRHAASGASQTSSAKVMQRPRYVWRSVSVRFFRLALLLAYSA